jgi:hypothetical protein
MPLNASLVCCRGIFFTRSQGDSNQAIWDVREDGGPKGFKSGEPRIQNSNRPNAKSHELGQAAQQIFKADHRTRKLDLLKH